MINVEVKAKEGENNTNLIRRFSKKVQSSGIIPRLRNIRYNQRALNDFKKKKKRLTAIKKTEELEKQVKLGKAPMPRYHSFTK